MKYKLNNGKIIDGTIVDFVGDWVGGNVLHNYQFSREFTDKATLALSMGCFYVLRIYFRNDNGCYLAYDYGSDCPNLYKYMQEHLWDDTNLTLEK